MSTISSVKVDGGDVVQGVMSLLCESCVYYSLGETFKTEWGNNYHHQHRIEKLFKCH